MPFNLLVSKQPSIAKHGSSDNSGGDPSHPIFTVQSTDTEERKLNVFRKMFSSNSDAVTRKSVELGAQPRLVTKRSSLVPPNFTTIFKKRHFPLTRTSTRYEWADELISVPDNGILTELEDMYDIFEEMEKRPLVLTSDDIDLFYEWFSVFYSVVEEMFLLEETCLYAWIEKTDDMTAEERKWEAPPNRIVGDLSEARRLRQKGKIMTLGRDIKMYRKEFVGRPALQGLPGLAEIIEKFVDELIHYMELKKEVLPNCIKARFSQKDRSRFEKNYWRTARKMEMPAYTVIAATRWMDRGQIRRWKAKWFAGPGKGVYGKWKKTFETKHREIIEEFKRRVVESQHERDTQVRMHEMARARAVEVPKEEYSETASMTRDSCISDLHDSLASSAHGIGCAPTISAC